MGTSSSFGFRTATAVLLALAGGEIACGKILDVRPAATQVPSGEDGGDGDGAAPDAASPAPLAASTADLDLGDATVAGPAATATFGVTLPLGEAPGVRLAAGSDAAFAAAVEGCVPTEILQTCTVRVSYGALLAGPAKASVIVATAAEATQVDVRALGVTTLRIAFEGDGRGMVKTPDGAVACSETCEVRVATPELALELEGTGEATPAGIHGDCEGRERCSLRSDGAKSARVTFREPRVIELEGLTKDTVVTRLKASKDGHLFIAGHENGSMFVHKARWTGETVWHRPILIEGKTSRIDPGLALDDAGNSYLSNLYGDDDYNGGQVLAKIDANGAMAWVRTRFNELDGIVRALAVHPTSGQVVSAGYRDAAEWVRLRWYDADGNMVFERLTRGTTNTTGHSGNDIAMGDDGSAYVCGGVTNGTYDFWLGKYDPGGNALWSAAYDGPLRDGDVCSRLALGRDGLVAVGTEDTTLSRAMIRKVTLDGKLLWADTFGVVGQPTGASSVAIAQDDAIAVVGSSSNSERTRSEGFVRLYDATGHLIWIRQGTKQGATHRPTIADAAVGADGAIFIAVSANEERPWLKVFYR